MRRALLWVFLLLLLTATPAMAGVRLTVEPAFEGHFKDGEWVTLWVEVRSDGEAASGEVVVQTEPPVGMEHLPRAQYAVPFNLPAGGTQRLAVSVPDEYSWPVSVRLYTGGELAHAQTLDLTWEQRHTLLAGVLTDDDAAADALAGLRRGDDSARVVRVTAESLPDSPRLLASLDLLMLARHDSTRLTARQLQALEVWVARGGTLLLFGGPDWERTLGPLPGSLKPVNVSGVAEVALAPLGDLAGVPLDGTGVVSIGPLSRGTVLVRAESATGADPGRGGQPAAGQEAPVLAAAAQLGSGRVIYLAYDPVLAPVAGWAGHPVLLDRLASLAAGSLPAGDTDWRVQQAIQQIPDWGLPPVWLVGLVLGGYLVAVGPVNYLVLRRLDRREWGWVTVPLLSLLFLGAVYGMGAGRFRDGITHVMTTTELVPGAETGVMTGYVGLYAPGRTQVSFPLPGAGPVRPLTTGAFVGGVETRIVVGDPPILELSGLTNYNMTAFALEQPVTVPGGLEVVDLQVTESHLTGRVRNGLPVPVTGVEVATAEDLASIGDLGPGEMSEPFTVGRAAGGSPDKRGPIPPIWAGPPDPDADPRRQELRAYAWEAGMGRLGSGLLVMGWTAEPLAELPVPDLGRRVAGANLVFAFHPLPAWTGGDLAPGVILGRPVDADRVQLIGQNAYYAPPGSHRFVLTLPPLEPEQVAEVAVDLQAPVREAVMSVFLRNQRTGEWLPLREQRTVLPDWQDYVLPGGTMELRYDLSADAEFVAPTVAVKGVR
ncbi:MAG: hypothetical protein DIU55_007485 [Bacillota bacterium]